MTTYTAESRAAYGLISDYPHHPTTDDGWSAAASHTIATGENEAAVRHELSMHLITGTTGMQAEQQKVYYAASTAIVAGVDAVQISGRVFRIRKES